MNPVVARRKDRPRALMFNGVKARTNRDIKRKKETLLMMVVEDMQYEIQCWETLTLFLHLPPVELCMLFERSVIERLVIDESLFGSMHVRSTDLQVEGKIFKKFPRLQLPGPILGSLTRTRYD